jgi:hypothetical protein
VIVAMLLLGALAAAACLVAAQVARIGRAAREGVHALYAAEAGLASALALWPDSVVAGLAPGETVTLDPVVLANGDRALLRVERIDDARSPALARLLLHAYGRARTAPHAGRHLVIALTRRPAETVRCPDSVSTAHAPHARALARLPREIRSSDAPHALQIIAPLRSSGDARLTALPLADADTHAPPSPAAASASSTAARPEVATGPRYTPCIPTGVPGERPVPVPLAERPWAELYW